MEVQHKTEVSGTVLTQTQQYLSIKNYGDQLELILPNLKEIFSLARSVSPPNMVTLTSDERFSEVRGTSSNIRLFNSRDKSPSDRTLTIDDNPIEIIIDKAPDDTTLTNIVRLLGEYSPKTLLVEEAQVFVDLLKNNPVVEKLKHKRTGIRVIINIPKETFVPLYNLPPVFNHFTGREKELQDLEAHLGPLQLITTKENPRSELEKKSQVAGPGGIGKSVLANHFARLQFRKKYYHWVIWLNGGDDDAKIENNLLTQLSELGTALGFKPKKLKPEDLHRLIYQRLAAKGKGLVVIDDAPNYRTLKRFLPTNFGQPQIDVLVTTRNSVGFGPAIPKVIVDIFTLEDAKKYIRCILKELVSDEDASLLAETLGFYPLALTQALAYISLAEPPCSIAHYCKLYNTKQEDRKQLLKNPVYDEDPYIERKNQLETTMWVVIQLSLERVKELCKTQEISFDDNLQILKCAASLAPEHPIPMKLLTCLLPNTYGEILTRQFIANLRNLSLLGYTEENQAHYVHKVIQDVLKLIEEPRGDFLARISDFLRDLFEKKESPLTDDKRRKMLFPHLQSVLKHFENLPDESGLYSEKIALLSFYSGNIFSRRGNSFEAVSCYQQALRFYESSGNEVQVSTILVNLGLAINELGDSSEAKAMLERALEILRRHYGPVHPLIAPALMNLANVTLNLGEALKAKMLFEQTLLIQNLNACQEHEMARTMMGLGLAMQQLGKLEDAIAFFEQALPIFEGTFGSEYREVAEILMNIGCTMRELGNWAEASTCIERALPVLERTYGSEHPRVVKGLVNLGTAIQQSGNPMRAKALFERALPILERIYGLEHVEVTRALSNLAAAMLQLGDALSAKPLLERALMIQERTYGSKHPDVAITLMNIGNVNYSSGAAKEAKASYERALLIQERFYGAMNINVAKTLINLGMVTLELGDAMDAKVIFERAILILEHTYGPEHPEVAIALGNLGTATLHLDDALGAKALLERALAIKERAYGLEHPEVATPLGNLGLAYLALHDASKAKALLERALLIQEGHYGPGHIVLAKNLMNLGQAVCQLGDEAESIAVLERVLQINERRYGPMHIETAKAHGVLGHTLSVFGHSTAATEHLQQCVEVYSVYYGAQHSMTQMAQDELQAIVTGENKADDNDDSDSLDKFDELLDDTLLTLSDDAVISRLSNNQL